MTADLSDEVLAAWRTNGTDDPTDIQRAELWLLDQALLLEVLVTSPRPTTGRSSELMGNVRRYYVKRQKARKRQSRQPRPKAERYPVARALMADGVALAVAAASVKLTPGSLTAWLWSQEDPLAPPKPTPKPKPKRKSRHQPKRYPETVLHEEQTQLFEDAVEVMNNGVPKDAALAGVGISPEDFRAELDRFDERQRRRRASKVAARYDAIADLMRDGVPLSEALAVVALPLAAFTAEYRRRTAEPLASDSPPTVPGG